MKPLKKVFEDSPTTLIILLLFAGGLLILLRRFLNISPKKQNPLIIISKILKKQGLEQSMILLLQAQAIHETGNFTSRLFKEQNNLFGMKMPRIRPTTSIASPAQEFASFLTLEDSVSDQVLYLEHFSVPLDIKDAKEFARVLKINNYYTDTEENYARGINNGLRLIVE